MSVIYNNIQIYKYTTTTTTTKKWQREEEKRHSCVYTCIYRHNEGIGTITALNFKFNRSLHNLTLLLFSLCFVFLYVSVCVAYVRMLCLSKIIISVLQLQLYEVNDQTDEIRSTRQKRSLYEVDQIRWMENIRRNTKHTVC